MSNESIPNSDRREFLKQAAGTVIAAGLAEMPRAPMRELSVRTIAS